MEFQIHKEADRKPNLLQGWGLADWSCSAFIKLLLFFFYVQIWLKPWNSDSIWSPYRWHSFPVTKLNNSTTCCLSFYENKSECIYVKWNIFVMGLGEGNQLLLIIYLPWSRPCAKLLAYLQSKMICFWVLWEETFFMTRSAWEGRCTASRLHRLLYYLCEWRRRTSSRELCGRPSSATSLLSPSC